MNKKRLFTGKVLEKHEAMCGALLFFPRDGDIRGYDNTELEMDPYNIFIVNVS